MIVIVDASVAVKWVVSEPGTAEAVALLAHSLAAPALWLAEAANALWAKAARGELRPDEVRGQVADLADAPVRAIGLPVLLSPAVGIALELNHPVYDCLYLAAAVQRDTHVVTADRRLVRKVDGHPSLGGRVRLLGA